jgi:DNA polymerase III subunit epsilon
MRFAIVDIETTGSYAAGSRITEIAIVIHDGVNVLNRYETLINPQCDIPRYINSLTGIDNEMLEHSPTFEQVADSIYELLNGCIFVAHNVNFDFSFVKHQLAKEGYILKAPKLCTVRLSRKIRPGLPSYSLGNLCTSLNIPIVNRHRAGGDADATVILFSKLLEWDTEGYIDMMLKKNSKEQVLPPNVPKKDFDVLPNSPGVYYFRDKGGKIIYVGKAKSISKRVASHFAGTNPNPQRQHFLQDIHSIDFETCGTELMALLLEAATIKRLWPKYNKALKRYEPKFGLFLYEGRNDYLRLVVGKYNKSQVAIHELGSLAEGTNLLHRLVMDFGLCPELCKIGRCKDHCCPEGLATSDDSIVSQHGSPETYNQRVHDALAHLNENLQSFAIVDKGRHVRERGILWVEKGNFYGMGYIDKQNDLQSLEEIKPSLTRYESNRYVMQLISAYAEQHPNIVRKVDDHIPIDC